MEQIITFRITNKAHMDEIPLFYCHVSHLICHECCHRPPNLMVRGPFAIGTQKQEKESSKETFNSISLRGYELLITYICLQSFLIKGSLLSNGGPYLCNMACKKYSCELRQPLKPLFVS